MAYYTANCIADIGLHKIRRHDIAGHVLCVDTPAKVIAIVPAPTFRTYVRISSKCGLVYAVNADIDVRVAPRRLVCRNCIVRLPAHHMGISVSFRNCRIESNSAIAVKTCVIEHSTLSGIIVVHAITYSKIADNRYIGNFAFRCAPPNTLRPLRDWHMHTLVLKDTQTTGTVPIHHLPNILYLNIARSMFTHVAESATLRYMSVKQCAVILLGTYRKLCILNARGATCIGTPTSCVVFAADHPYQPEYLYKYHAISNILLKIRRNEIRHQEYRDGGREVAYAGNVPALQPAHEQTEHDAFYNRVADVAGSV